MQNKYIDELDNLLSFLSIEEKNDIFNLIMNEAIKSDNNDIYSYLCNKFGSPEVFSEKLKFEAPKNENAEKKSFEQSNQNTFAETKHINFIPVKHSQSSESTKHIRKVEKQSIEPTKNNKSNEENSKVKTEKNKTKPSSKKVVLKARNGLVKKTVDKFNVKEKAYKPLYTTFCILYSPIFLFVFLTTILLYSLSVLAISVITLCVGVIMIAIVVAGIVGICYGLIMLFKSFAIGLIELGIGTSIFGIAIVLLGICYELISGTIPFLFKKITKLFIYIFKKTKIWLFGEKIVGGNI